MNLFETLGSAFSDTSGLWDKIRNGNNSQIASENLAYQKELQQQIWEREDTANQRAVTDMRAAGLSPLANFSQAAPVTPQQPLENKLHDTSPLEAFQQMSSVASMFSQIQKQASEARLVDAQARKTTAEADAMDADRPFWDRMAFYKFLNASEDYNTKHDSRFRENMLFGRSLEKLGLENDILNLNKRDLERAEQYMVTNGFNSAMNDVEKMIMSTVVDNKGNYDSLKYRDALNTFNKVNMIGKSSSNVGASVMSLWALGLLDDLRGKIEKVIDDSNSKKSAGFSLKNFFSF